MNRILGYFSKRFLPRWLVSVSYTHLDVYKRQLELFGSKIKALIERTATRDLYDVYNMITHYVFSENQLADLRKVVIFYLAVGGNNPPKTKYENFEAIDALNFSQFRANLIPVLRKSEHFDFETAKSRCV